MRTRTSRALAFATAMLLGVFAFEGLANASPPANDDFANATQIAELPFAVTVDTSGATGQDGEPADDVTCASGGGASVWYRLETAESMRVASKVIGFDDFDVYLGVYRGESFEDLELLGCGTTLFTTVEPGETYYLQLGGVFGAYGAAYLEVLFHGPVPEPCESCPAFVNHVAPNNPMFDEPYRAGEVSIGVNPKTNTAMMLMLTHALTVKWDEQNVATWNEVTGALTGLTTNDPILWTDRATGRTFVAQMLAQVGSVIEFSDDDGTSWIPSEPGITQPSWDHQTIGAGPYPQALRDLASVYPNAVYFCAQAGVALNQCVRSDNGGVTWGPPLPMNAVQCLGLHGHVAVASDGTVVVPHRECGTTQGIEVSADGAHTWELRRVPETVGTHNDPKVAFDAADRLYFATESEGHALVATSMDRGRTWAPLEDLGERFGIRNAVFPMVVAGDAGRAAVAFYGTQADGDYQSDAFADEWHLYVSFTYDGGQTWQTVDATPGDPVQRGCIWMQGGDNKCRNLLDFQDMTIDAKGRVLVGYADGCVSADCLGIYGRALDSRASIGVIARQSSGKGLLAAFDPEFAG